MSAGAVRRWRFGGPGIAAGLVLAAAMAGAAQAPVINAKVERRALTQGLAREVQAIADRGTGSWVGYGVPILQRADSSLRVGETCCGRCRLEPPTELVVLVRVETRAIVELRPVSVDCDVDAAGMPLVWFDAVNPDESVAWLASLVNPTTVPGGRSRVADAALMAMAQHATPAAAPVLVRLAREGGTTRTRSQALFWLAQRATSEALPAINAALDRDPETEVKRQAVFALSRLPNGEGLPRLMEVARTHANIEVRRQAMFWLGQSKDPRAIDFFASILLK